MLLVELLEVAVLVGRASVGRGVDDEADLAAESAQSEVVAFDVLRRVLPQRIEHDVRRRGGRRRVVRCGSAMRFQGVRSDSKNEARRRYSSPSEPAQESGGALVALHPVAPKKVWATKKEVLGLPPA